MSFRQFTTILPIFLILLGITLLTGHAFDQTWAGGEGFQRHDTAEANGQAFTRGERLFATDYTEVQFGNTRLFLDKNTEIVFLDGREHQHTIQVIQGRLITNGNITLSVRETKTQIEGSASFVHYSWLDIIEIAPLTGTTELLFEDQVISVTEAVSMQTLPPYTREYTTFDPLTSSAKTFYEWALAQ